MADAATSSPLDMTNVVNLLGQVTNQNTQSISQISGAAGAGVSALAAGAQAATQAGQDNALVVKTQAEGQLKANQQIRTAMSALGTNMDDPSQIVTMLGADMRNSYQAVKDQQQKVNDIESNANLLNIPGLLKDILVGDSERAKLSGLQANYDNAAKTLQGLNQATSAVAVSQQQAAQTQTVASVAAQADAEAQKGVVQAAGLKAQAATLGIESAKAAASLTLSNFQATSSAISLQSQMEQREFMQQVRLQQLEDREQSAKFSQSSYEWYKQGLIMQGADPNKLPDMNSFLAQQKLDPHGTAMYTSLGMSQSTGMAFRFGNSPMDALQAINSTGVKLSGAQKDLYDRMVSMAGETSDFNNLKSVFGEQAAVGAQRDLQSPKTAATVKNYYITKRMESDFANIDPGNASNFYSPRFPASTLNPQNFQESPFLQKYLAPSVAADPTKPVDFNTLLAQGIEAVKSGEFKSADVSKAFNVLGLQTALNIDAMNPSAFGLPSPTKQQQYNLKLKIPGQGYKSINMLNPVMIERAIAGAVNADQGRTQFWNDVSKIGVTF